MAIGFHIGANAPQTDDHALAISLGQKVLVWKFCSANEVVQHAPKRPSFSLKEVFSCFGFLVFLTFSHYVSIVFPTCPQGFS
jgi:hypothetical protein